ncbi:thioredoxin family protein [Acinetobacter sp.]|jgi:thioredoxin 1|uniref:thioredoxin family protein n=1 Tax=Acinetobacter sp. TaxID=472 RepID=UPI002823C252|nr:thioredoxin family protein [Acinetobacter sp.]MDR2248935.1 thioredoxin family protein [Acinetobacter sp.]
MTDIHVLTLDNFSSAIRSTNPLNEQVAIIFFSASWCQPCKNMKSVFQQVVDDMASRPINFGLVDIAQSPNLAQQYGIKSVPSIAIFKESHLVKVIAGEVTFSSLTTQIEQVLKRTT